MPPSIVDRAIAAIAKTLPVADSDKDGIRDEDDACPDRAGAASTDPLRNGCPVALEKFVVLPDDDGHIGGGRDQRRQDQGPARQRVRNRRGHARRASPRSRARRSPRSSRATAAIAQDAAARRPRRRQHRRQRRRVSRLAQGPPSSQPMRNGCPHVGRAASSCSPTRTATSAPSRSTTARRRRCSTRSTRRPRSAPTASRARLPAEASRRLGAATPPRWPRTQPGARIILYFTARSEPVRDLTGPLDNLVAEVKAKTTPTRSRSSATPIRPARRRRTSRIGRERAQLIADRLIAAGVPPDRITVTSMGSREPAVKRKSRRDRRAAQPSRRDLGALSACETFRRLFLARAAAADRAVDRAVSDRRVRRSRARSTTISCARASTRRCAGSRARTPTSSSARAARGR